MGNNSQVNELIPIKSGKSNIEKNVSKNNVEPVENVNKEQKENNKKKPRKAGRYLRLSRLKSQLKAYIDNYLDVDEIFQFVLRAEDIESGYPNETGLRKLFEFYYGNIVSFSSDVLHISPSFAVVKVDILTSKDGATYTFSGIGECSAENASEPYSLYPVSMAETRAFTRIMRRAINLRIPSKEELNNDMLESERQKPQEKNDFVISMIRKKAGDKKINLEQFCRDNYKKEFKDFNREELSSLYQALKTLESVK